MNNIYPKLLETMNSFIGKSINTITLSEMQMAIIQVVMEDMEKSNLSDIPFFNVSVSLINYDEIIVSPGDLYSAIWAFGIDLSPMRVMLRDDKEWFSTISRMKYTREGDNYYSMEFIPVEEIDDSDE